MPEIYLDDQLITLPTRKALALLIYVAVERRSHAREQLMALFWPDSNLKQAQASLRTTLAYIRKALPGVPFLIERDVISLEGSDHITLDTEALQTASASLSHVPLKQSAYIAPLHAVAQQIRGDFLAGFSLNDSPEFDDWASTQREFYHQQALQVYEYLSYLQLQAGKIHDGLETTTRWIKLAPFDETAYQRQMELYLAQGNRIAALQAYKTCCLMLANEYGLKASAQTEALVQQAQLLSESGRRVFDAEAECIALNRMAMTAAQSSYDLETALNLLRQALALANQLENPLHRAETHWNLSHTYFYQGDLEIALSHGEKAACLARELGRNDLLGRALNTIAYVKLWSGESIQEIDTSLDEAIDLFEGLHQPAMVIDCLTIKANVRLSYGFSSEGLRYANEALKLSEEIHNDWGYASASYNAGLASLDAGNIQKAIDICERGMSKARIAGHPPLVFFNLLILGHAYRDADRLDLALISHQEADQIAKTLKSPFFQLLIRSELCADYVCLDRWLEAEQCAIQVCTVRERIPYSDYASWYEIRALFQGGHTDLALQEIKAMQDKIAKNNDHRRLRYFLERGLALQAQNQKRDEREKIHLTEAEYLAGEFGFLSEQINIRRALEKMSHI